MPKGKLIVFEGIDGCGKDTQITLLGEKFANKKYNVPFCNHRQPTNGNIGELIRNNYLSKKTPIHEYALRLLFAADCLDHITRPYGVIETTSMGINILCSRFYHSNIAYGAMSFDIVDMIKLNKLNRDAYTPDLTILLDIDAQTALSRINNRGGEVELYEEINKLRRVREIYLDLVEMLDENIVVLDATLPKEELSNRIFHEAIKVGVMN